MPTTPSAPTATSSGNQPPVCTTCQAGCTNDSGGGTEGANGGSSDAPVNGGNGGTSVPGGGSGPTTDSLSSGGSLSAGPMHGGGSPSAGPMHGGGSPSAGPMHGGGSLSAGPMHGGGSLSAGPMHGGGSLSAGPMHGGGSLSAGPMHGGGGGLGFGHSLSFSNVHGGSSTGVNGNGWFVEELPTLAFQPHGGVGIIGSPANTLWFGPAKADGTHPTAFPFRASLRYGPVSSVGGSASGVGTHQFTLTKDDGSTHRFNPSGLLTSVTDAGGNTGTASYNPRQQLTTMTFQAAGASSSANGGAILATNQYSYVSDGSVNHDQLESVVVQVAGANVRRSRYEYYGTNEAHGNVNDLKRAFVDQWHATTGTWQTLSTCHYRYYLPGQPKGYVSGLRFVVGAQAYAAMVAANLDPLTATDAQVAAYADLHQQYDGQRRVTHQTTQAGAYSYTFTHQASGHAPGTNSWANKMTETLPDGNQHLIYTNAQGQAMLRVFVETATGKQWCTYWQYDYEGKGLLRAEPSAVASFDEALPGLVILRAHEGLVHTFSYYGYDGAVGSAPGYFQAEGVQQGGAGTPTLIRHVTYTSQSVPGVGTVYPVASSTLYQSDANGGSDPATTSYSYQWYANSLQMSQRVTTWPVVSTSQNGSGQADRRTEVFDAYGRTTWLKDERGFLFHTAYDATTGAVTQQVRDVQTTGRNDVPNGWTTPAGGGLNLVTDYQHDVLGRTTQVLGPVHTIDLNGTATSIRRATWTVYQDTSHQTWTAMGHVQADGSGPVLMNPVSLVTVDQSGRTIDVVQATRGSGTTSAGALSANDTFAQNTWCRWQHTSYDTQGHLTSTRTYFLIPPSGGNVGTKGVNYNESTFGYDPIGRQVRSVTPGGTISRAVFSAQGWLSQSWVGTNDTGATDQDPSGGHASGNNLVNVSTNQYDQGQAGGDGNLTQTTLYQDASTTRVTTFTYDFRNRRVGVVLPAGASRSYTFNNRNRTTQIDQYDPTTNMLVSRRTTTYDNLERIYEDDKYAVDPVTGATSKSLANRIWYDPNGKVIKQLPFGSQTFTKNLYDGAERLVIRYTSYNPSDSNYPYPINVAGDTVVRQIKSLYDDADNLMAQTVRERDHNASGTGALTSPGGAQPQARVSYLATYPDALGRMIVIANYGTNAAAAWTRPAVAPAASDTVLVSSAAFDAQGNRFQQTDAQGIVTQASFDQAGRMTKQLSNVVTGSTNPDQNQEMDYTYNADGQMLTLVARNNVTGDQTTCLVYGISVANGGSDVARNDLLAQKVYPANSGSNPDTVTYVYNRQGELKSSTDGNGTVHRFMYDALGRQVHDCVTALGGGVDGAVRRISRSYEVRGPLAQITSFDNATVDQGSVVNEVLFAYNGFGQLVADYQAHNGAVDTSSTPSVQYTYADGSANTARRTGITYPSGRQLTLSYGTSGSLADSLSRLDSIVDASANNQTLASFQYLGLDTRVRIAYPEPSVQFTLIGSPGGDGGDQYVGLDRFSRLVDQRWTNNVGNDLERVQFGYSRASNKVWRHNPVAAAAGAARDEFYGYDGLYQLTLRQRGSLNTSRTGLGGTPAEEESFAFDPTGNWTNYQSQANGSVTLNQARTHNVDNEITALGGSPSLVAYDHAGNLITLPQPTNGAAAHTLTWDAWNRPVKVASDSNVVAIYAYDGLTRRTHRGTSASLGSDFFYSDQWKVLEERVQATSQSAASTKQFVWCGCSADKLVLRDVHDPAAVIPDTRLYALDDGKDVTALCDASGTVQERFGYSAFGAPVFMDGGFALHASSASNWETLFCGYRFDADTGLYQVRFRYLHAQLGRWLSRDPLSEFSGYTSKGRFLYLYVDNRPLEFTDSYGLDKDGRVVCDGAGHLVIEYPDGKGGWTSDPNKAAHKKDCDFDCTQAHEQSHMDQYNHDDPDKTACNSGVPLGTPGGPYFTPAGENPGPGSLPGGMNNEQYRRQQECNAYKAGLACRTKKKNDAKGKLDSKLKTSIDHDNAEIAACCNAPIPGKNCGSLK